MTPTGRTTALFIAAAVSTAAVLTAIDVAGQPVGTTRFFTVLAVEPKGGTSTDQEPFPKAALPSGGGYVLTPPDATSRRWQVSAYVWQPSQLVVSEGDDVTIEFAGINGAEHPTTLSAFGQSFTVKRGETTRIRFKADKVGFFSLVCSKHQPSMTGELVVLPRATR
jgi:plastocyanin